MKKGPFRRLIGQIEREMPEPVKAALHASESPILVQDCAMGPGWLFVVLLLCSGD